MINGAGEVVIAATMWWRNQAPNETPPCQCGRTVGSAERQLSCKGERLFSKKLYNRTFPRQNRTQTTFFGFTVSLSSSTHVQLYSVLIVCGIYILKPINMQMLLMWPYLVILTHPTVPCVNCSSSHLGKFQPLTLFVFLYKCASASKRLDRLLFIQENKMQEGLRGN